MVITIDLSRVVKPELGDVPRVIIQYLWQAAIRREGAA